MRGLGSGYTQVLLNGDPLPAGFAVDSLAPDMIERVEILRTATADLGTQAIAGTVNIVLKKRVVQAKRELKAGLADVKGTLAPNLSIQASDKAGDMSYTVTGTLIQNRNPSDAFIEAKVQDVDGSVNSLRHTQGRYDVASENVSVSPRVNWTFSDSDKLNWQGLGNSSRIDKSGGADELAPIGHHSQYPSNRTAWTLRTSILRSDIGWEHRMANGTRVELQSVATRTRRDMDFLFTGMEPVRALQAEHHVVSGSLEDSLSLNGKYLSTPVEHHALSAGWQGSQTRRTEYRREHDTDVGLANEFTDDSYNARINKLAFFAQDEWDVSSEWSANLGVRWEKWETIVGADAALDAKNRNSVFSPLMHTVWRPTKDRRLRLAVSRTYKTPSTESLIPRLRKVDNANSPINPNSEGNPNLRPELAWGLDASIEQYFAASAMVSGSAFVRRIENVILTDLLQTADGWLQRPVNAGNARTFGVELESKFPLRAVLNGAPQVELRANLVRAWSKVERIPGPDNRLDEQTPLSANLGWDHRVDPARSWGISYGFRSGGNVRKSVQFQSYSSARRSLDVYGVWAATPGTRIRVSATNLLHQTGVVEGKYTAPSGIQTVTTLTPSSTVFRLAIESNL
ncbi:MAG: bifunctional siderophore receptor/adhesin Iha [Burkholderiaceae bacterium]